MKKYEKFKLAIFFTFGIIFSTVFYNFSENGRYVFSEGAKDVVLDTKKGIIYFGSDGYLDIKDAKKFK